MVWKSPQTSVYKGITAHSGIEPGDDKREDIRKSAPKSAANPHSQGGIQLNLDRDLLLILGLIFILRKELADEKLILALLFVMLS